MDVWIQQTKRERQWLGQSIEIATATKTKHGARPKNEKAITRIRHFDAYKMEQTTHNNGSRGDSGVNLERKGGEKTAMVDCRGTFVVDIELCSNFTTAKCFQH